MKKNIYLLLVVCLVVILNAEQKKEEKKNENGITKEEPLKIHAKEVKLDVKNRIGFFSGDVLTTHKDSKLTCDNLKAYGETPQQAKRIECMGNVIWIDVIKKAELHCGFAIYDKAIEHLIAREQPVLTAVDSNKVKTIVTAEELEIYVDRKIAYAKRNVNVIRKEMTATSEYGTYDYGNEIITLEGNPLVKQRQSQFSGEKIIIFVKENKFIIQSKVEATVFSKDIPTEKEFRNK